MPRWSTGYTPRRSEPIPDLGAARTEPARSPTPASTPASRRSSARAGPASPRALLDALEPTGVCHLRRLQQRGFDDRSVARLVQTAELARLRRGWYSVPSRAQQDVVAAIGHGGLLTGARRLSLIADRVWLPLRGPLDILVPGNHPEVPSDVRVLTRPRLTQARCGNGVVPAITALRHVIETTPELDAVAIVDTLLNALRLGEVPWAEGLSEQRIVAELMRTGRGRRIARIMDAGADSGPESIARQHCLGMGWTARTQVPVNDSLTLDLEIEGVLGVEIDGSTHVEMRQYRRDRRKDAISVIDGRPILRFDFWQVMERVQMVHAIAALLARLRR